MKHPNFGIVVFIAAVATLAGFAFGYWQQSSAAGIFAGIAVFALWRRD